MARYRVEDVQGIGKPSRSARKRAVRAGQEMVLELAGMGAGILNQAPVSGEVKELLLEAARLKGSARKRLVKFAAKRLRQAGGEEALAAFLETIRQGRAARTRRFHRLEDLRRRLLDEAIEQRRLHEEAGLPWEERWDSDVLREIERDFAGADVEALRRLAYRFSLGRDRRHSREVFRLLQAALEPNGSTPG